MLYTVEVMSGRELGDFENIVLVSVRRLGQGAYCATLRAEIQAVTCRDVGLGAVQTTLARLERKGLLSSTIVPPIAEVGGRSKRLYRLEAAGRAAFARRRDLLERLYIGFDTAGNPSVP